MLLRYCLHLTTQNAVILGLRSSMDLVFGEMESFGRNLDRTSGWRGFKTMAVEEILKSSLPSITTITYLLWKI